MQRTHRSAAGSASRLIPAQVLCGAFVTFLCAGGIGCQEPVVDDLAGKGGQAVVGTEAALESPEPPPEARPLPAPPIGALHVGPAPISEAEFLALLATRIGPEPPVNPERARIFEQLEAEIKARGVDFRVVPQSAFRTQLYAFKCPSTVTFTLQDNFGPPGDVAGLMGTWTLDKLGSAVDFNKDGKRFRENESAVANVGSVTLGADQTYSWQAGPEAATTGRWREATSAEMKYAGGAGIVLVAAKAGWDWIVTKDRVGTVTNDGIALVELTSRQIKELGRR